jgi:TolA-binding protein
MDIILLLQQAEWSTIAAVVVALVAVIGLGIQFFKNERPWKRLQDKHHIRLTQLEEQLKATVLRLEDVRKDLDALDARDTKDIEHIENKIEKIMDMMIQLLSSKDK